MEVAFFSFPHAQEKPSLNRTQKAAEAQRIRHNLQEREALGSLATSERSGVLGGWDFHDTHMGKEPEKGAGRTQRTG